MGFGGRRESPKDRGEAGGTEGMEAAAGAGSWQRSAPGPLGSSVMSGRPWQASATRELITVTYLPVHLVLLKSSPPQPEPSPTPPVAPEPAWLGGIGGWAWGHVRAEMGRVRGGRRGGSVGEAIGGS